MTKLILESPVYSSAFLSCKNSILSSLALQPSMAWGCSKKALYNWQHEKWISVLSHPTSSLSVLLFSPSFLSSPPSLPPSILYFLVLPMSPKIGFLFVSLAVLELTLLTLVASELKDPPASTGIKRHAPLPPDSFLFVNERQF